MVHTANGFVNPFSIRLISSFVKRDGRNSREIYGQMAARVSRTERENGEGGA